MDRIILKTTYKRLLADTVTPVSIYLRLRDRFANSILLESSDYHGQENSFSFICCDPIAEFVSDGKTLDVSLPGQEPLSIKLKSRSELTDHLKEFIATFETDSHDFKFISNGLFGYMAFDAVQHFEDIDFNEDKIDEFKIPIVRYQVFKFVIALNHFRNEMYAFEHRVDGGSQSNSLEELVSLIMSKNVPVYEFRPDEASKSNLSDEQYIEMVETGISHCNQGDVFQIVLSRRFQKKFNGDEFQVYRALRSINPSPYLFYFDYGSYKIFGSSRKLRS